MCKVADEVCFWDFLLEPNRWFSEEINHLAIRFTGLDEMPKHAIFLLSKLSVIGPMDVCVLASKTSLKSTEVDSGIEALEEHGFVKAYGSKYEATELGHNAFRSIGRNLIIRKRFEMKRELEKLDCIYKAIDQSATW